VADEPDPVCGEEAKERVPYLPSDAARLEKRMPAETRVLNEPVALRHAVHAMPDEATGVSDFFRE
jgi:hypothetical protein